MLRQQQRIAHRHIGRGEAARAQMPAVRHGSFDSAQPRLLSTIVALYLIIMGILGLLGMHTLRF